MLLNPANLKSIADRFQELTTQLLEADTASPSSWQDPSQSPALLAEAMRKVLQLLELLETPDSSPAHSTAESQQHTSHDIHELGDYGFNLLADLSSLAGELRQEALSHDLEALSLPLAIWIARQGGELSTLEPIVNALAKQANTIREPLELERLYELTGEIQHALTPLLRKDLEKSNPGRPWRILLLNRAIIATRSHRPEVIEAAYENLLVHLPEEAAQFFRQGMEQMVALDYPQPVRQVVERYYNLWSVEHTLH
ncbi:MAG: hypothetical protein ABFR65_12345 [Pseudomonadota bacterium]